MNAARIRARAAVAIAPALLQGLQALGLRLGGQRGGVGGGQVTQPVQDHVQRLAGTGGGSHLGSHLPGELTGRLVRSQRSFDPVFDSNMPCRHFLETTRDWCSVPSAAATSGATTSASSMPPGRPFGKSGEDACMEEVAAQVGVGVGIVYRRFASKDALIGELLGPATEELV